MRPEGNLLRGQSSLNYNMGPCLKKHSRDEHVRGRRKGGASQGLPSAATPPSDPRPSLPACSSSSWGKWAGQVQGEMNGLASVSTFNEKTEDSKLRGSLVRLVTIPSVRTLFAASRVAFFFFLVVVVDCAVPLT